MESTVLTDTIVVNQAIYMRKMFKGSKLSFLSDYLPIGNELVNNGRALLTIPYCGSTLELLLFYSSNCYLPDIVWPAEYSDFTPQPIDLDEDIEGFSDRALYKIILNFLKDFSHYQLEKIPGDSDLKKFINHCLSSSILNISEWQLLVQKGSKALPLVQLNIKITMDTSELPANVVNDSAANFDLVFKVSFDSFYGIEFERMGKLNIKLPDFIKDILNKQNVKLENYSIGDTGLANAIFNYQKEIKSSINKIEDSVSKREGFLAFLLSALTTHSLEFDNVAFKTAFFLVEVNDFYCILEVHLDDSFPLSPPILYLRSIYHGENDESSSPLKTQINFPRPHKISIQEMARKVMEVLPDEISEFKLKR